MCVFFTTLFENLVPQITALSPFLSVLRVGTEIANTFLHLSVFLAYAAVITANWSEHEMC